MVYRYLTVLNPMPWLAEPKAIGVIAEAAMIGHARLRLLGSDYKFGSGALTRLESLVHELVSGPDRLVRLRLIPWPPQFFILPDRGYQLG